MTEEERKKQFYHNQRLNAEETGDQATTDKIYSKLGQASHSVDANTTDKLALGMAAGPEQIGGEALLRGGMMAAGKMGAGQIGKVAMGAVGDRMAAPVVRSMHPLDAALHVLETKMPGITKKIEDVIGDHHVEMGGEHPFAVGKARPKAAKTEAKTAPKNVTPKEASPKGHLDRVKADTRKAYEDEVDAIKKRGYSGKTDLKAGKTTKGVQSGKKPTLSKGAAADKPGPRAGNKSKSSAAPNKAPSRSQAPANPYSKEGIAAARGETPKNVRRQKKGV